VNRIAFTDLANNDLDAIWITVALDDETGAPALALSCTEITWWSIAQWITALLCYVSCTVLARLMCSNFRRRQKSSGGRMTNAEII